MLAEINKVIINIKFKIIGEAAAAANLLFEFNIAAKKDAKDTNNKKGKVILVNLIAKSIFWSSSIKPGANNDTKKGANNSTTITKRNNVINRILKIWFANLSDFIFLIFVQMYNLV